MSTDKRSVHTDALETLGTIIGENEKRDAIHLAVEPVIAADNLRPGQHVGLNENGLATSQAKKLIGIVDPFINGKVHRGERFWLVIYPRMINSLRHVWTHPDLPDVVDVEEKPKKSVSEQYIANLAESVGLSYSRLISGAREWVEDREHHGWGNYIVGGSEMEGESVPDEFWNHYEIVTGEKVKEEHRGSFFSCSC